MGTPVGAIVVEIIIPNYRMTVLLKMKANWLENLTRVEELGRWGAEQPFITKTMRLPLVLCACARVFRS